MTDINPIEFFKEFYYVKFAVGPKHIALLNDTLRTYPKEAQMLILTNTPELIDTSTAVCSIQVLDIDSLRSERSLQYEKLVKAYTEEEYVVEWHKLDEEERRKYPGLVHGYAFPLSLFRFAIPWLLERGYTKFVLTEAGTKNFNPEQAFTKYNSVTEYENIIFGHPIGHARDVEGGARITVDSWSELFLENGMDASNWPELGPFLWDPPNEKVVMDSLPIGFECWMLGFWFKDATLIQKYFDMWDEITLQIYEKKLYPMYNMYIFRLEYPIDMLNAAFSRYFNVVIAANLNLLAHSYTGADGFMHEVVWSNHEKTL